jgi:hypothetical protein
MQAIPATIGVGSSLIGGIKGKGEASKQRKLAEKQLAQIQPLLDAQIQGSRFALDKSKGLYGRAEGDIQGAGMAIRDLQNFWRPLMSGSRNAIDLFLSPERRAINQGYRSASENIARFAPRGGGRVASLARADIDRQGRLSDLNSGARFQGAGQMKDLAGMLSQLGLGTGSLATGTLQAGLSGGQQAYNLLQGQQNRAFGAQPSGASPFKGLGGFLVDIFKKVPFGNSNTSTNDPYDSSNTTGG